MPSTFHKDPDAVLDYKFDWDRWLDAGETITGFTLTAEDGLTELSDRSETADSDRSVVAWLSGGTAGKTYTVACRIETSADRIDERTIKIKVAER